MAKAPRHKHHFVLFSEETSLPDRKGRITVVTTWKCDFLGPVSCTKTRTKKRKHIYFTKRDI
jgi:hypothetical protein